MGGPIITVLYEDSLGVEVRGYGPHSLLLACVARRENLRDWHPLRRCVVAVPKKGNGAVRRTLLEDLGSLRDRGPVVAVLDDDKIRDLLGLEAESCRRHVLAALRPADEPFTVVLLERNIEDLVAVCARLLGRPTPRAKPCPDERDRILNGAACRPELLEALEREVPSFGRLVGTVSRLLAARGSPAARSG